jgi:potassium-transporting ATPase KdpC subunit
MLRMIKSALIIFAALVLITGVFYPLLVSGVAQVLFPATANGSQMINSSSEVVGSRLIGQQFDQPHYFWGRLSATASYPYNASASGGSNYSVLNQNLEEAVSGRIKALQTADPTHTQSVPVDLVTASGSGLDPDISVAAAQYQAGRVAKARGLAVEKVMLLIDQNAEGRQFGFLGEPRVNVLTLNLALDAIK